MTFGGSKYTKKFHQPIKLTYVLKACNYQVHLFLTEQKFI